MAGNVKKTAKEADKTTENKVVTRYDRKKQKRIEEQKKEVRRKVIVKSVCGIVAALIVVAIAVNLFMSYNRINNEFIKIGDDKVSEREFDFYYGISKQTQMSQTLYGTLTYLDYYSSYLGYDTSVSDKKQEYMSSSDYTWYDYFANNTVNTIKEIKGLLKAADENGFDYKNADSDYNDFVDNIKSSADEAGTSVSDYYKQLFGSHASQDNIQSYVKDYLKATAYQEELQDTLAASESDIKAYYEENKYDYDLVDYREFIIKADSTDENDLKAAKTKADSFEAAITDENSFADLCRKYATEDEASTYESYESSLQSKVTSARMEDITKEWLMDDTRKAADKTVIEDADNGQYYILYFINRSYNGESDSTIASTLLNENYTEFIQKYTDALTVTDKSNRIKMLTK